MKYVGRTEGIKHMLPESAAQWRMTLAAAILAFCLLLLLGTIRIRRKRGKAAEKPFPVADGSIPREQPAADGFIPREQLAADGSIPREQPAADGSITQELPVAAVRASLRALRTLEEIVFCESEDIIL